MGKNSVQAHGADGRRDVLVFAVQKLTIETDPTSPFYDERIKLPVDEALAASIHEHGQILPGRVVRDGNRTVVLDGRQRVRAIAWWNEQHPKDEPLPFLAMVARGDDAELVSMSTHANEHRRDDTPTVRAIKMQRQLNLGRTMDQVARAFRLVSPKSVELHLGLLDLSAPVRAAVDAGRIGISAAVKELGALPRAEQNAALTKLAEVRETKGDRGKRADGTEKRPRMRNRAVIAAAIAALETTPPEVHIKSEEAFRARGRRLGARDALAWVLGADNGFYTPGHGEDGKVAK